MSVIHVLGELPPSKSPWIISMYKGLIILCNEEYEPLIVADGKLIKAHLLPASNDSVLAKTLFIEQFHINKRGK